LLFVKNFKTFEFHRVSVTTELCTRLLKFSHAGSHVKCYVRLFEDLFARKWKSTASAPYYVYIQYVHSYGASRTTWKVPLNSQSDSSGEASWSVAPLEKRKRFYQFLSFPFVSSISCSLQRTDGQL